MSDEQPEDNGKGEVTWGPRLFYAAVFASLAFFYWLLVYDHGVVAVHGG